jgi:Reverse transcriptase (RNA-dependent DNA polymerase)
MGWPASQQSWPILPQQLGGGRWQRNPNQKFFDAKKWLNYQTGSTVKQKVHSSLFNLIFLQTMNWNNDFTDIKSNDLLCFLGLVDCHVDHETDTIKYMHHIGLSMQANSEDNPTWEAAMNGSDQAGYWQTMHQELDTLESKSSWEVVDRKPGMHVLPCTWAFWCKWFPDGTVRKLKARFCVCWDRQIEGVDYFNTFAPIVSWQKVQLMLILLIVLNLSTKEVDYTAAFVHAPIDHSSHYDTMTDNEKKNSGVFVAMPRGFTTPDKVLRLQNCYTVFSKHLETSSYI